MQAAEATRSRINNKMCLISPHIFVCLLRFILSEWIMYVCREHAFTHQQVLAADHMYVEVKSNLFCAPRHFNEKHKCSSRFDWRKQASVCCLFNSLSERCEFVIIKCLYKYFFIGSKVREQTSADSIESAWLWRSQFIKQHRTMLKSADEPKNLDDFLTKHVRATRA